MNETALDLRIPGTGKAVPEGGCGKDPERDPGNGGNGASRLTVPVGTLVAGGHLHPCSVHRLRARR
ncbi:MAG: hypothetical protein F4Y85_13170 [Gammaproteobacteria bacterium]|nr:hypothetical protein [Gammaproteobacteria bacterium]